MESYSCKKLPGMGYHAPENLAPNSAVLLFHSFTAFTFVLIYLSGGLNNFIFRVADRCEVAFEAFGFTRDADAPSVPDQLVGELNPFVLGDDAHEVVFDFSGILVLRQIETPRKAHDVSVHDDATENT